MQIKEVTLGQEPYLQGVAISEAFEAFDSKTVNSDMGADLSRAAQC